MPIGELGVRILTQKDGLQDRIWEHTYDFRNLWQFGQVTVTHEEHFNVSKTSVHYINI